MRIVVVAPRVTRVALPAVLPVTVLLAAGTSASPALAPYDLNPDLLVPLLLAVTHPAFRLVCFARLWAYLAGLLLATLLCFLKVMGV
jgi:hypothetical protein